MAQQNENIRRPLTVWELPKLLTPVHEYRKPKIKRPIERAHFKPILAFIYRNRYVLAQHVQRRFTDVLKSDRTTRRHLSEMESLGYIKTVPVRGVSPLWPKTFSITAKGARRLRDALEQKGKNGHLIRIKRTRREGFSHDHCLHELATTEFLLMLWEDSKRQSDFEVLDIERRSVTNNPNFRVPENKTWIEPDAHFMLRFGKRGAIWCALEIDTGTMTRQQLARKFARYDSWICGSPAQDFILNKYRQLGKEHPKPNFRLLFLSIDTSRVDQKHRRLDVFGVARRLQEVSRRIWYLGGEQLGNVKSSKSVNEFLWRRSDGSFSKLSKRTS